MTTAERAIQSLSEALIAYNKMLRDNTNKYMAIDLTTLSPRAIDSLNRALDLRFTKDEVTMIFFLVSKSEHNNQDPKKTFVCANGDPVWTYAEALSYDWRQRGVTCGVVGFTSANCGKAEWGDAQPMLKTFRDMGGPDLLPLADTCHENKASADSFCRAIHELDDDDVERFCRAQMSALTGKKGYLYEAVAICRELDVPPKPLLIAALFDTLLNFGIGGKYCPLKWLRANGKRGSKTKTLRRLLRWKRKVSCLNNHNSCDHNGHERSDMFRTLLRKKEWNLDVTECCKVVRWRMK
jgi:hypothetical protein